MRAAYNRPNTISIPSMSHHHFTLPFTYSQSLLQQITICLNLNRCISNVQIASLQSPAHASLTEARGQNTNPLRLSELAIQCLFKYFSLVVFRETLYHTNPYFPEKELQESLFYLFTLLCFQVISYLFH
jgi:hypothetical protein